jgi:hypothetical protein
MPKEFNLSGDKWDDVDPAKAIFAKNAYITELFQSMLKVADGEPPTPKDVTDRLVNHCIEVTKKSREYMENNQGRRLPEDYVEFPGKMDHTSCLCFRVGRFPTLPEKGIITTPSSTATFGGNLSGSSAQVQVPSLSMSSSSLFLTSSLAPNSPPNSAIPAPSSTSLASSGGNQITNKTDDGSPRLLGSPSNSSSAPSNNYYFSHNNLSKSDNWTKISPSIKHS